MNQPAYRPYISINGRSMDFHQHQTIKICQYTPRLSLNIIMIFAGIWSLISYEKPTQTQPLKQRWGHRKCYWRIIPPSKCSIFLVMVSPNSVRLYTSGWTNLANQLWFVGWSSKFFHPIESSLNPIKLPFVENCFFQFLTVNQSWKTS